MKTLYQISVENPDLYISKALQANRENKILEVDQNGQLVLNTIKRTKAEMALAIRCKRNALLNESDKIVSVPDYPIDNEKKQKWIRYRQELRDITLQPFFPNEVVWPEKP